MLSNQKRKQFEDHNLLYILKHSSNKSYEWIEIRRKSITHISDLALIASKSPDDKLQQIFNENTLKDLLWALFLIDQSESKLKPRSADVLLASKFVEIGLRVCISEYEKWNKDTPKSSEPTIEYLNKAIAICNEIGFKYRMNTMEKKSLKNKTFIGIWEELYNKNYSQFKEYLSKEIEIDDSLLQLTIEKNIANEKEFHLILGSGDPSDSYIGKVIVNINLVGDDGTIKFYDDQDNETRKRNIAIKRYNSQTALYC